jgi:carboxylate-amine ligase
MLISENVWRAQRYGASGSLMDYGRGALVPFSDLVDEWIDLVSVDADELGCTAEVEHARIIAREGTSAHRQLESYRGALAAGASEQEALEAIIDELIEDTMAGT